MSSKILHITNGNALTDYLVELNIAQTKNIITWQETLCVGPTVKEVASAEFIEIRKAFFKSFYDITLSKEEITNELEKLNDISDFTEIILWL